LTIALAEIVAGMVLALHPGAVALSAAPGRLDTYLIREGALPSGQWSMFKNTPGRQGRTPLVGAQSSKLAWRISMTGPHDAVIGLDGTIYLGTEAGELVALNPDGTRKWTLHVPYRLNGSPAILLDGRITYVDEGGVVYVVNPNGTPSWKFDTGTGSPTPHTAPAIGYDGTIYTGIGEILYAFRPDGSIRWTYDLGFRITGAPAIKRDGTIYVVAGDLLALDSDGSLIWRWQSQIYAGLGGAPAIGQDETIYVNAYLPTLYAINPDGTLKWSYQADDCCVVDVPSSPAIGRDGTIYVGEGDGVLLALRPDGTLKWKYPHDSYQTSPSVGGDGTIYFGNGSGKVFAINPDGKLLWRYSAGTYVRQTPAIGLGRRVYVGSFLSLMAFGP
jgi:outer membrane protein assembly factor BamB